jgi:SAM-dependent methyltransferase
MVFFQAVLLAGYAYAHGSLTRLGVKRQQLLQGAVLLLSLFMLPRAFHLAVTGDASPVVVMLAALTLIAGVPFFVLSTNSSLTQRWFSLSSLDRSDDPFWLYAASNVGSLIALLAYPFIVEPALGLEAQLRWWSIGYVVFVVLSLAVMYATRRTLVTDDARDVAEPSVAPIGWPRRVRWILLAAIASSLLLSVTMQIATDVMSAPLFWVLPLAIYLLTFVIAFSPGRRPPRRLIAHLTTIGTALCFTIVIAPTVLPLWFALVALLGTLFCGALLCHGDLADDRPAASQLTDFYLAVSIGGALGGIANSLLAPLIFRSVVEFPLTLAALALVLRPLRAPTRVELWFAGLSVALLAAAAGLVIAGRAHPNPPSALHWQLAPLVVLAAAVFLSSRPTALPVAATLAALFVATGLHFVDPIIDQGRSFFGVSRVTEKPDARVMIHGVTVHGAQFKSAARRDVPVSYYYPRGPLGWAVSNAPPGAEIGIVGLGAGSLAPLARAGQRLTYFEIDPLVEQMARRDFTFLADARAAVDVRIGDGRQLLDREPDDRFDLLVIDAFNSDAIPMHLLTDEAIGVYLRKLKPSGLLVMHISNRYADIARVLRGWRRVSGLRVAIDEFVPTPDEDAQGVLATVAVAIGRSGAALAPLAATKQWYWLEDDGPSVHWTDDQASLLSILDKNVLRP